MLAAAAKPRPQRPLAEADFLVARRAASTQLHPQTTFGRNRFFGWPALWQQRSSILKGPLAETDFLLARLVASTQLHPQTALGRNRFFCWPALWQQPSSSLKRPPALWHQPSPILKRPLAETDFLLARRVASTQLHPQRTLGRNRFFAASTQLHPQRTLGRNRFFCWPALWRRPSSIFKRPLAETDFLLARLVALTQLHPQRTLGRNRFFCWPALWRQPSCIFKRPLAETDFLRARIVASTQGPLADIALSSWPPREMTWAPAKASQQDFRH